MVIVVAVGQTILTTAGMLSGRISAIVSVSASLMVPEDRMVDWVTGTRFLAKWVSAVRSCNLLAGRFSCTG